MLMLDLNQIKIVNIEDYTIIPIEINIPNVLELDYNQYSAILEEKLTPIVSKAKENTLFSINFVADNLDYDDCAYFYKICGDIILKILMLNEHRDREHRLTVPNNMINLPYSSFLNCVNFKTIINCFEIHFETDIYENGMAEVR